MNMLAQWEDGENNRQIQFSIDFSIKDSVVAIEQVTPMKVTFVCEETNTVLRSVGVHTEKGKAMLCNQFAASGKLDELVNKIASKNGLLAQLNNSWSSI